MPQCQAYLFPRWTEAMMPTSAPQESSRQEEYHSGTLDSPSRLKRRIMLFRTWESVPPRFNSAENVVNTLMTTKIPITQERIFAVRLGEIMMLFITSAPHEHQSLSKL